MKYATAQPDENALPQTAVRKHAELICSAFSLLAGTKKDTGFFRCLMLYSQTNV